MEKDHYYFQFSPCDQLGREKKIATMFHVTELCPFSIFFLYVKNTVVPNILGLFESDCELPLSHDLETSCIIWVRITFSPLWYRTKVVDEGQNIDTVSCMLSHFSHVWLFVTPWTVVPGFCSWGLSRQEYWGELPCPPPGDLPDPGIEPPSLMSPDCQAGYLPLVPPGKLVNCLLLPL